MLNTVIVIMSFCVIPITILILWITILVSCHRACKIISNNHKHARNDGDFELFRKPMVGSYIKSSSFFIDGLNQSDMQSYKDSIMLRVAIIIFLICSIIVLMFIYSVRV